MSVNNGSPRSNSGYDPLPPLFSKSVEYELVITDKSYFKRFLFISVAGLVAIVLLVCLLALLPHKHKHHGSSKNLTLALSQALTFFDAQKSGNYPNNSPVKIRGSSGLTDGNASSPPVDLVGGFYDSGNNIKFSFPTAYTVTLLSWTVIEYHKKYESIGELDHVKDIIKWGSDYLLKVFTHLNSTSDPITLYSQVGGASNKTDFNDISCWQRPEDMNYLRPVSVCDGAASDLAGEIVAALSAASMVLREDKVYSLQLIKAAEFLFKAVTKNETGHKQVTYTDIDACGGEARMFYNSSGFMDELIWGGTWLFFATGNTFYLDYATTNFVVAEAQEAASEEGIFNWNNKLTANSVLLTRVRYFRDPGNPYESGLISSSSKADGVMCSYLSKDTFQVTRGGLILLRPERAGALELAATASFLVKLYSDYLQLFPLRGVSCGNNGFLLEAMRRFSMSQINYILGENPKKISYIVGFGDRYPSQVHHRAASIPWDRREYSCQEGDRWKYSKDPNPNVIYGAMVAGPDRHDDFIDDRNKPWFTEASIASNAGLVAALIALHDPPPKSSDTNDLNLGIDKNGIFQNFHLAH